MLVTEAEARRIRCPLSFGIPFADPNGAEVDRSTLAAPVYCIASRCMAWRRTFDDKGYCGLAGPVSL